LTDKSPVRGQWPEAPLALVLAQLRFETFMDLDAVAVPFREQVEKLYPRVQPIHRLVIPMLGIGATPQEPPKPIVGGYAFNNAENTKSVRLEVGALTYAVSSYAKYEDHFEKEWRELVAAVSSIRELFVTRIGLRYVDFIIPAEGASPDDYVVEPLGRTPAIDGGNAPTAFNLFEYTMAQGQMRVQYGRGVGRPELPPDLQNLQLALSPVMTKETTGSAAILDTDRWMEPAASLPIDGIMPLFATMHADMSTAFRRIITPRALKEWGAH